MPDEIKLDEIKAFLRSYLTKKSRSTKKQAEIVLRHWEEFVRQKPADQIKLSDVDQFIFDMSKHLEPSTLLPYLFHLAKYFGWAQRQNLEKHIMRERKNLQVKTKNKSPSTNMHQGVLKMLKSIRELQGKLILRLLLWSEIPINCLENLKVRHIAREREYEVHCSGRIFRGELYSDTPQIIKEMIEKQNLKQDDDLINVGIRQIQNLIPDYARKIGLKYKVTPHDLRKFAENPQRDMLIDMYENDMD